MMTHGLTCCPELARVSKGIKSTHTKSVGFISTTTARNTRRKKETKSVKYQNIYFSLPPLVTFNSVGNVNICQSSWPTS